MITDVFGVCKSAPSSPAGRGEKRESSRMITEVVGACKSAPSSPAGRGEKRESSSGFFANPAVPCQSRARRKCVSRRICRSVSRGHSKDVESATVAERENTYNRPVHRLRILNMDVASERHAIPALSHKPDRLNGHWKSPDILQKKAKLLLHCEHHRVLKRNSDDASFRLSLNQQPAQAAKVCGRSADLISALHQGRPERAAGVGHTDHGHDGMRSVRHSAPPFAIDVPRAGSDRADRVRRDRA